MDTLENCERMKHWLRISRIVLSPLIGAMLVLFAGCNGDQHSKSGCKANCEGRCGIEDNCGGQCTCATGQMCNPEGTCVTELECTQTCLTQGWMCGEVCGQVCGQCDTNEECIEGRCICQPHCDGTHCGDDGCGGTCACPSGTVNNRHLACVPRSACTDTCASAGWHCGTICGEVCGNCETDEVCYSGQCQDAVSCSECSLQLRMLSHNTSDGAIKSVTLAIEYQPGEEEAAPRMFDLRLVASAAVTVTNLVQGPALLEPKKQLYVDPATGYPYRKRTDGSIQFVAYSIANTNTLGVGRIMTITLSLNSSDPVSFSLQKRDQTFAPAISDSALQATSYNQEITVWP